MANSYAPGSRDTRPWGSWEVLAADEGYAVKRIVVTPKGVLSLQKHKHRGEDWIVVAGEALVTVDDDTFPAGKGTHINIPKGAIHRLQNNGDVDLVLIEVQMGDVLDEEDIERLEDVYGRS